LFYDRLNAHISENLPTRTKRDGDCCVLHEAFRYYYRKSVPGVLHPIRELANKNVEAAPRFGDGAETTGGTETSPSLLQSGLKRQKTAEAVLVEI
jgi:hypothetical protein